MKITNFKLAAATFLFLSMAFAGTEIKLNTGTILTINSNELNAQDLSKNSEWIVQYKTYITSLNKKNLEDKGIQIFGYLPEDALIVRGKFSHLQSINKSEIQAVLPFTAKMKISPRIKSAVNSDSTSKQTFLVSAFAETDVPIILKQLKQNTITVLLSSGTSILVSVKPSALIKVAAITGVEHIQHYEKVEPLHFKLHPKDKSLVEVTTAGDYSDINGTETGTLVMNFESAWNLNFLGQNQVVGMADTGLDSGDARGIHGDFNNAVKSGYAVGLFGKTWADPMGHGTHVAGSVLGRGTVSGGKLKGAAYEAQIVAQGMWSPILNNLSVPADLGKMFVQAYDDGARLHTNSWGSAASFGTYEKMAATVDQVCLRNKIC